MTNRLLLGIILSFSASTLILSFLANETKILILSLQYKIGGEIVSKIELFANDFDPNSSSISDEYQLSIDSQDFHVPESLLSSLDRSRREYSYDFFTGGIKSFVSGGHCRLGGEPAGWILQVRYLTYVDSEIVGDEMKSVYSENDNCLFSEGLAPNKPEAEKAAAKAMAVLKTIMALLLGRNGYGCGPSTFSVDFLD